VGFWGLFAKPKMLQAGILKKLIPPTEKNPAEGKWLFIRMPSLALAGSITELVAMVMAVWRED
jgi:hypothetical protein